MMHVSTPANMPLRGAVDLSALAQQRQAQQRQATAGPAPAGIVIDVTEETFQTEVIERSQQVPVVVDLWATWCGPCKTLSPILEALAAEYGGRFILAKVDVDAQPRIASAFQVQSIPSVFAIVGGQPMPLFQGALPEPQARQYIEELLKAAEQAGVAGTATAQENVEPELQPEEVVDPRFAAAYEAMESGDWALAEGAYRLVLAAEPNNADAQAGAAMCALQVRVESANTLAAQGQMTAHPLTDADAAAIRGDWSTAFAVLIEAIRSAPGDEREELRARLLDLFTIAGDDPAVAAARIALSSALF